MKSLEHIMNDDLIWNIIAALGTGVAIISFIYTFVSHRLQKNESYFANICRALQILQSNTYELNRIFNYELIYDLVHTFIYADSIQPLLKKIYDICNKGI